MKRSTAVARTTAEQPPATRTGAARAGHTAHGLRGQPGRLALAVVALFLLLAGPSNVRAAGFSFTVNSTADTTTSGTPCASGGAGCSLRQALQEVDGLPFASLVLINLAAATYSLSAGPLTVSNRAWPDRVIIQGAGASTTIIQGAGVHNFTRLTIAGVTIQHATVSGCGVRLNRSEVAGAICNELLAGLALSNITLSGNTAATIDRGGAIYNDGVATVIGSTLSGNSVRRTGGAVYTTGTFGLSASTVSDNHTTFSGSSGGGGAGIYNDHRTSDSDSALTVIASTISGNGLGSGEFSGGGGVVNNFGVATISGSTFNGNTAPGYGAGINNSGTLMLTSSTISGNSVGGFSGGGLYNTATATVSNSTISGNTAGSGGGIDSEKGSGFATPSLSLGNSIVAKNTGGDCNFGITVMDQGYNLDSDNTCKLSVANHDLPNTADPKLGPLGSNGGPSQTLALLTGSPAIDAGGSPGSGGFNCAPADQRGVRRPQGAACDIGAFERTTLPVPTLSTSLSSGGQTGGSITIFSGGSATDQATLSGAAGSVGGSVTYTVFTDSGCGTPLPGATSSVQVTNGVVPASQPVTFAGSGNFSTFNWQASYSGDPGNAPVVSPCQNEIVFVYAPPQIASFTVNSAADSTTAGTPCADGTAGKCSLRQAVQEVDNLPAGSSATITFQSGLAGPFNLTNGRLVLSPYWIQISIALRGLGAGSTVISGAGLLVDVNSATPVTVDGVTIQNGAPSCYNGNGAGGAGICNYGSLTLSNSTIAGGNVNRLNGGGIWSNGTLTVGNSTITGNTAASGGGIWSNGTLTVGNSTITGNTAEFGGGIENYLGTLTLNNSTISGNTAGHGGGIDTAGEATQGSMTITSSTIAGNHASTAGGGINSQRFAAMTIIASTISGNSAPAGAGAGIDRSSSVPPAPLTLGNSIVARNSSLDCKGAVTNDQGFNVDGDGSCGLASAKHDLPSTDPQLGPLGNNGGPTQTLALLSGSPAIDAGGTPASNPTCVQGTDQR
ncbi:MAG: choice-of-anchor Q domain-containing protein, partial [Dehalococcoidia bacterium]